MSVFLKILGWKLVEIGAIVFVSQNIRKHPLNSSKILEFHLW